MSINDVSASQCSFVSRGVMTRVKRKRDLPTETKVWQKVLAEAIYCSLLDTGILDLAAPRFVEYW